MAQPKLEAMLALNLALLYHLSAALPLSLDHAGERAGSLEARTVSLGVVATYLVYRLALERHMQAASPAPAILGVALLDEASQAIHSQAAPAHAILGSSPSPGSYPAAVEGHGHRTIQVGLVVVGKPQVACRRTQVGHATQLEVAPEYHVDQATPAVAHSTQARHLHLCGYAVFSTCDRCDFGFACFAFVCHRRRAGRQCRRDGDA